MLKYTIGALSNKTMGKLAELQANVDALPNRKEQYDLAKKQFSNKSNAHFKEVKSRLTSIAPGGFFCYYCEQDRFRDIEHIFPKLHYPNLCFDWFNYVFACSICNQDKKSDTFAVFDANGEIMEFDRKWDITHSVPQGQIVLIDIRQEDPLDFLMLELETGQYVPIGDTIGKKRGKWTRDLFDLNNAALTRIRKHAYVSLCNYLQQYQTAQSVQDIHKAMRVLDELRLFGQPTVLVEMRRQMANHPVLQALFSTVPDDIGKRPQ